MSSKEIEGNWRLREVGGREAKLRFTANFHLHSIIGDAYGRVDTYNFHKQNYMKAKFTRIPEILGGEGGALHNNHHCIQKNHLSCNLFWWKNSGNNIAMLKRLEWVQRNCEMIDISAVLFLSYVSLV